MILVDEEIVVEISAHLLGGRHGRAEIEFAALRKGRGFAGEGAHLDACRERKLRGNALVFKLQRVPLLHSEDIVRPERQQVHHQHADGQPERMRDEAEAVKQGGARKRKQDDPGAGRGAMTDPEPDKDER